MNNPSKILSEKDKEFLKEHNVIVPNCDLDDEEWKKFIMEITINLEQEDAERIIDFLSDN